MTTPENTSPTPAPSASAYPKLASSGSHSNGKTFFVFERAPEKQETVEVPTDKWLTIAGPQWNDCDSKPDTVRELYQALKSL